MQNEYCVGYNKNDANTEVTNILYIIEEMEVEDVLLIYDYGHAGNEKLWIEIDDDNDVRIETDIWTITNGEESGAVEFVDRTYISRENQEELKQKLLSLWAGEFEGVD